MYILLPPSEAKLPDLSEGRRKRLPKALARDTAGVMEHLRRLSPADQQRFYGVKDTGKAAMMHERNLRALDAPALKALERYTGVVYANIGYPDLEQQDYADKYLLIVSGMFGLIPGGTPIPDYKLPMNSWLARYWKSINQRRISKFANKEPVISLLPQAHMKAIPYEPLLHIDFVLDGGKKSAGHFGKAIKGKFVRWIIENRVIDPAQFVEFEDEGYRFDGRRFVQF